MLALAALSLLGLASASPINNKRIAQVTCDSTPAYTSTINISYLISKPDTGVTYYFGFDNSVTTEHQGFQVPILANAANAGGEYYLYDANNATQWDFYPCQSTYMGTTGSSNYGHIKPAGDSKNCLQTETGSIKTKEQYMVIAPCSYDEDAEQQQQTFDHRFHSLDLLSTRLGDNQVSHPTHFGAVYENERPLKLFAGDAGNRDSVYY